MGGQESQMEVFDKSLKACHRDRAALLRRSQHDPLLGQVTERLLDRLEDCAAKFPRAVVLGGAGEYVAERLVGGRGGIQHVTHMDVSAAMLDLARERRQQHEASGSKPAWPETEYIQLEDEELLPLEPGSVDVVISCLGLHWANDLPGVMAQCCIALKPDGLFLAALFGGDTLQELRIACSVAQQEREGGVSPFVSPLVQMRDAGSLLTRAGLALPAVDTDTFVLRYADTPNLVHHLRRMAETSGLAARRRRLRRDTALAAAAVYRGLFEEEDGTLPATYQVMYLTGWSPAASQPRAARRGSATVSFEEFAREMEKRGATAGGGEGDEGSSAAAAAAAAAAAREASAMQPRRPPDRQDCG